MLRGYPLDHYLDDLKSLREMTLEGLAAREDEWLERSVTSAPKFNVHWAWFHAAEDEINHRGQIRRCENVYRPRCWFARAPQAEAPH